MILNTANNLVVLFLFRVLLLLYIWNKHLFLFFFRCCRLSRFHTLIRMVSFRLFSRILLEIPEFRTHIAHA